MATTCKVIDFLVSGVRDSTGTAVASGKVRFYQPGTLVAETVYSDYLGTTGITQPLTLDAGGRAPEVYCLNPVRIRVWDATDTTLLVDIEADVVRAQQVYATVTGLNGGAETTLHQLLLDSVDSFGAGWDYLESAGATARSWQGRMAEIAVSVKDFGAVGDDSNDDTAEIQAAIDRASASGARIVWFPRGTYKITSALTCSTPGVQFIGASRLSTTIKQYTNGATSLSIDYGTTHVDSGLVIDNLTFDSAGTGVTAIAIDMGIRFQIRNVKTQNCAYSLNITGITSSLISGSVVRDCYFIQSSPPAVIIPQFYNAMRLIDTYFEAPFGTSAFVQDSASYTSYEGCSFKGGATTTGLAVPLYGRVTGCFFDTGASGIASTATGARVINNVFANLTTGIVVSLANGQVIAHNAFSVCTTDINASANTLAALYIGNAHSTFTGPSSGEGMQALAAYHQGSLSGASSATFTPAFAIASNGVSPTVQTFTGTYTGGAQAITIGAPSNLNTLLPGSLVILTLVKTGANAMNLTWNSAYLDPDGSAISAPTSVASNTQIAILFRKGTSTTLTVVGTFSAQAV
jgi:hypothetical protein